MENRRPEIGFHNTVMVEKIAKNKFDKRDLIDSISLYEAQKPADSMGFTREVIQAEFIETSLNNLNVAFSHKLKFDSTKVMDNTIAEIAYALLTFEKENPQITDFVVEPGRIWLPPHNVLRDTQRLELTNKFQIEASRNNELSGRLQEALTQVEVLKTRIEYEQTRLISQQTQLSNEQTRNETLQIRLGEKQTQINEIIDRLNELKLSRVYKLSIIIRNFFLLIVPVNSRLYRWAGKLYNWLSRTH
jgi:hypothetical protein